MQLRPLTPYPTSHPPASGDLGRTMYRFSFRIPPYYTLLVRSLSVLEGIALASDPNYKVTHGGSGYHWGLVDH
jgi:aarF domain-containing kinase